jgi:hypothetical protein
MESSVLCKDCKYFKRDITGVYHECKHPVTLRVGAISKVTGKVGRSSGRGCESMRRYVDDCGAAGKLFDPKPTSSLTKIILIIKEFLK